VKQTKKQTNVNKQTNNQTKRHKMKQKEERNKHTNGQVVTFSCRKKVLWSEKPVLMQSKVLVFVQCNRIRKQGSET